MACAVAKIIFVGCKMENRYVMEELPNYWVITDTYTGGIASIEYEPKDAKQKLCELNKLELEGVCN
jgi:hypothetical protein